MQGRQDQNDEHWDRLAETKKASLNGTGHHRALPQRPPGMARLNTPPEMARVPRPQRQAPPPKKTRRFLIILSGVLFVAALLACSAGYWFANSLNAGSGAAVTATDFLSALNNRNYDQAYKDLGPAITIPVSPQQFMQRAQGTDTCYGPITDYKEVDGSAKSQGNNQSYTYTITRKKLAKPYELHLTLQQDQDDTNSWKIINYGNDLGPQPPPQACS